MPFFSRRELLAAVPALALTAKAAPFEVLAEYPKELQTPLAGLDGALLTPTERFFVRSHFGTPSLLRERGLEVGGLVGKPLRFAPAELAKLPQTTHGHSQVGRRGDADRGVRHSRTEGLVREARRRAAACLLTCVSAARSSTGSLHHG